MQWVCIGSLIRTGQKGEEGQLQREDGEAMRSPGIQGEDEQAGIALCGEDEAQQGF